MRALSYPTSVGGYGGTLPGRYRQPVIQQLSRLAETYPVVSSWFRHGRITLLDKSLTFTVPAGSTVLETVALGGGFDVLVFTRTMSVVRATDPGGGAYAASPNELANTVAVSIARKGGDLDTEETPLTSAFGQGYSPNDRSMPEYWAGKTLREISLTNAGPFTLSVTLTFTIVLL